MITGAFLILLLIAAVFVVGPAFGFNLYAIGGGGGGGYSPSGQISCPDTGLTNVTFNVQNILDTTTADVYDETMVCTTSDGSYSKSITQTSDDGTNLPCGETFVCKGTSSDGIKGDHANFQSILTGDASVSDGVVTFTTSGSNMRIDIGSTLHGVVQARLYDNSKAAFCFDSSTDTSSNAAGTWINTTKIFQSTTNQTALAVGTGGNLDLCMDFHVYAHTDEQFSDFGWYLMIDANTNIWDTPVVTVDGVTLSDYKGSLNTDEAKAYSAEEYVYKITNPDSAIKNVDYARACISISALAGVDPTTDINVTIASVGAYTGTSQPSIVKRGSVKDDASQTAVFTKQVWDIDVS